MRAAGPGTWDTSTLLLVQCVFGARERLAAVASEVKARLSKNLRLGFRVRAISGPRRSRADLRQQRLLVGPRFGDEEAEAKVARMAQAQRPTHGRGQDDAEGAAGSGGRHRRRPWSGSAGTAAAAMTGAANPSRDWIATASATSSLRWRNRANSWRSTCPAKTSGVA